MGELRQVIIGNSAGALAAIRAIREVDNFCSITVISDQKYPAYSPVLLTYYLSGRISWDGLFTIDSDLYNKNKVKTLFGSRAIAVDTSRQVVYLENNGPVEYDNLLIATGASPIGLNPLEDKLNNVFCLRTIEDAQRILEKTRTAKEVVVVGSGLIGLQAVEALSRKGLKLTLIEWSKQLLPEMVDVDCASIIQREIESHGITVLLGRKVEGIKELGGKSIVVVNSGEELAADMVIVGIGLKPNIEMLKNSGIKVNRGILVDEFMRTNISNVFAAGDVSEGKNLVTGRAEVLPNWPNACSQGRIAGLNMAGCEQKYEGISEAVTHIFGLITVSIGLHKTAEGDGLEELCFCDLKRKRYRKLWFAKNRMVGAVLLGAVQDAGMLKNLIVNKRDISAWVWEIFKTPLDVRKLLLPIAGDQVRF
jgi:NAD(P)H-nitrite reductase large subunit